MLGPTVTTIDLTRYHPIPGGPDGRTLLGRAIEARRNELDISREQVNYLGGPTHQTVYEIERGKKSRCNTKTLRGLERALELVPNTLVNEVLLQGEDPTPLAPREPMPGTAPEPAPAPGPSGEQEVNRDALYRMMLAMGKLYGSSVVMSVAAQVVEELGSNGTKE